MDAQDQHDFLSWQSSNKRGKLMSGMLVIVFGILFLLNALNFPIPNWIFSWEIIMIGVGLVVLVRHKFRKFLGYAIIAIGFLFVLKDWYPDIIRGQVVVAVGIIFIGLTMLFKSKNHENRFKRHWKRHAKHMEGMEGHEKWKKFGPYMEGINDLKDISKDDFIDAVSIFGGVQKNVVSKQFRGADIVTIFGGNELNLSQADFEQQVVLDITTIFGGTTLVVPSDWQLRSEVVTIFGSIEDKRKATPLQLDAVEKVIILRGSCIFGGIEVNSYGS